MRRCRCRYGAVAGPFFSSKRPGKGSPGSSQGFPGKCLPQGPGEKCTDPLGSPTPQLREDGAPPAALTMQRLAWCLKESPCPVPPAQTATVVQPPRASAAPQKSPQPLTATTDLNSHCSSPKATTAPKSQCGHHQLADPVFLSDSPARGFLSPATAKAQQEKNKARPSWPRTPCREGSRLLGCPRAVTRAPAHNSDGGAELSVSCGLATTKRPHKSQNLFVQKSIQVLPSPLYVKKTQSSQGSSLGFSEA